MPSVSTAELQARAQAVSDVRDNFVTPTQWMYWASQERLSLDLFLARSGWTVPIQSFDITVAGTENGVYLVNPPGGVMAVVCVHEMITGGAAGFRRVRFQDSISFMRQPPGSTSGARGHARFFRMQWLGDNLTMNLYPEPNAGEVYRISYIAQPNKLTLTAGSGTQATANFAPNFVLQAIQPGVAGNNIVCQLSGDGTVVGGTLATDTSTLVHVQYRTGGPASTWQQVINTWNTSQFVQVLSSTVNLAAFATNSNPDATITMTGGASADTVVNYPMGWEERLVLGMARRALIKEESDTRSVDDEIKLWESRIEEACWNRVMGESPVIRNVDQENYGWNDRIIWPPYPNSWFWA